MMKSILCSSAVLMLFSANSFAGVAPVKNLYANGIVGNNIINMQNLIMETAINKFGRRVMDGRNVVIPVADPAPKVADLTVYGKMPVYGEYGDDGTVFGRSGGDFDSESDSLWGVWDYFDGYMHFDNFGRIDTHSNLGMVGSALDVGLGTFGVFGGYAGSRQDMGLSEDGGFAGVFDGLDFGDFSIAALADVGVMFNESKLGDATDEFTNLWLGVGLSMAYDIHIDDTFVIQPSVSGGYTWIRTPNYMSVSHSYVSSQNFNSLNLIPELQFIKNIIGNWYGIAHVKYVVSSNHGGVTDVDGIKIDRLDYDNHTEYGIVVEKHMDVFDLAVSVGRYDGAYTGWKGSASIKYIF